MAKWVIMAIALAIDFWVLFVVAIAMIWWYWEPKKDEEKVGSKGGSRGGAELGSPQQTYGRARRMQRRWKGFG